MVVIGIAGETGFQRGDGKAVNLSAGKKHCFFKEVVAHCLGGIAGDAGGQAVPDDISDQAAAGTQHHCSPPQGNGRELSQWCHIIEDMRKDKRKDQITKCPADLKGKAERHFRPKGSQIM